MKEKQQQLLFDKGITNVPSDALCSDNALEESLGMVYDNGEHRVIQKPAEFMRPDEDETIPTILYVHKFNDESRFIVFDESEHKVEWGTNVNGVFEYATETIEERHGDMVIIVTRPVVLWTVDGNETPKIESIGKTLIISDNAGMHYRIWKEDAYQDLGDKIPEPKFDFWLTHGGYVQNTGSYLTEHEAAFFSDDANNLIIGLYAKNKKAIAKKKGFCNPFFIRTALELYDGTYIYISQPILMFPSVRKNSYGGAKNIALTLLYKCFYLKTKCCYLHFSQEEDKLADWSDIVKGIGIFISDEIEIYDTSSDQKYTITDDGTVDFIQVSSYVSDGVYAIGQSSTSRYRTEDAPSGTTDRYYDVLTQRRESDIESDIKECSIFYKLCTVGLKPLENKPILDFIDTNVIENITTQEQLPEDDYFSRSKLVPDYIYSYNSRLNLSGVSRSFFEGFDFFTAIDTIHEEQGGYVKQNYIYDFYVTIKTDAKEIVVHHRSKPISHYQGLYFYYPDSRATNVVIKQSVEGSVLTITILDADLSEHKRLNGAYYFSGLPGDPMPDAQTDAHGRTDTTSPEPFELLPNYIVQSEVNNPFVFKAAGYFKVGTGKILAMSSITQALSEGQFGQFPLLVFSESGVWALTVSDTGYYSSSHPISREVSLDPACIIQTDGAVFFTSAKGLMVVIGSQVKCVSEQLSGKMPYPFADYLKTAFIAYDYRDSLLWIFDGASHTENNVTTVGSTKCWVYSIKSGTFGRYDFGSAANIIKTAVNNYPDYLLQDSTKVYSLMERPNINKDNPNTYNTVIKTRPMKLENALALKSIMQIKHIHDMNTNAAITFKMYGSNNLKNWVQLQSLRGTPWKYYRFEYDFANLIATDRFAGTVLVTQERRIDKLR